MEGRGPGGSRSLTPARRSGESVNADPVAVGWPGTGPEVTNGATAHPPPSPGRATPDLRRRFATTEGGPLKIATVSSERTPRIEVAAERACLCARVAADHKARDITVLDMRGITPLYDFLV